MPSFALHQEPAALGSQMPNGAPLVASHPSTLSRLCALSAGNAESAGAARRPWKPAAHSASPPSTPDRPLPASQWPPWGGGWLSQGGDKVTPLQTLCWPLVWTPKAVLGQPLLIQPPGSQACREPWTPPTSSP